VLKPVRLEYPVHPDPVHGVQQGEIGNGLRMWELPKVLNRKVSRLGARMSPAPPIQGGAGDSLQKTRISDRLSIGISQVTDAGIVSQAVRPATQGRRVVPIAPARSISGRMVVRRRPTCDGPPSGLPSTQRMSKERPHPLAVWSRPCLGRLRLQSRSIRDTLSRRARAPNHWGQRSGASHVTINATRMVRGVPTQTKSVN
jgi:hypothetical protein